MVSEDSKGFKSVSYAKLVAPLIGAVKELEERNLKLEKENSDLLRRTQEIERQLKEIQKKLK